MGAAAAIVGAVAAVAGTTASVENAAQTRRLAGQAKNRADVNQTNAENARKLGIQKAEDDTFNKIKRQRERGMAASAVIPGTAPAGTTMATGGATTLGAPSVGATKTTLGS